MIYLDVKWSLSTLIIFFLFLGGAVTVPALTVFTDISHYQALGTSLCAMSLPALAGTFTHYQKGNVSMKIAVPLACGAFFGYVYFIIHYFRRHDTCYSYIFMFLFFFDKLNFLQRIHGW